MVKRNNGLTETEIKKYYELNNKEEKDIQNAFKRSIKDTVKQFLHEKYGNSFASEQDVRLRFYYNVMQYLNTQKLVSSINGEIQSLRKIRTRKGKIDLVATNPTCFVGDIDIVVGVEFGYTFHNGIDFENSSSGILKEIKKEIGKLKEELKKNKNSKFYYIYVHTYPYSNIKNEESKAEQAKKFFDEKLRGKKITYVYLTRYQEFGKKCPYGKTGIVKSNDKDFENYQSKI